MESCLCVAGLMCLFIVRRQPDGSWKIARLIANSDLPPAGGP